MLRSCCFIVAATILVSPTARRSFVTSWTNEFAGISFAPGMAWEVVLETECSKMALSIEDHHGDVSLRVTYLSVRRAERASRAKRLNDTWAHQVEGQIADLKSRIPILQRLIAECDRLAGDLEQEVRNEENRVKIHDPADIAYSTYAKAAASRRDNLRHSADELRAHLTKAEKALREFGESTLNA
jgi:chromosome segregation ATPase